MRAIDELHAEPTTDALAQHEAGRRRGPRSWPPARSCSSGSTCRPAATKTRAVGADQLGVARSVISPTARRSAFNVSRCVGRRGRRWRLGRRRQHAGRHEVGGVDGHRPGGQLGDEAGARRRPPPGGRRRPCARTAPSAPAAGAAPGRRWCPAARSGRSRPARWRRPSGARPASGAPYVSVRAGLEPGDRPQVQPGRCLDRQLGARRAARWPRAPSRPAPSRPSSGPPARGARPRRRARRPPGCRGSRLSSRNQPVASRHAEAVDRPRAVQRRADGAVVGVAAGGVGDGVEQLAERRRSARSGSPRGGRRAAARRAARRPSRRSAPGGRRAGPPGRRRRRCAS